MASLVSFSIACVAICASLLTLVHYYRAYEATEDARVRAARFERERSSLIARVGSLEGALLRTQRFAAKLDTLAGDEGSHETGVGPLDNHVRSLKAAGDEGYGYSLWRPPSSELTSEELISRVDLMKERTDELEHLLHRLFSEQQDRLFFWSSIPSVWPTRGFITSHFGAGRGRRRHEGLDLAGPVGSPIVAPGDGLVTFVGYKGGYGNTVKVDHGYGMLTVYAHCSRIFVQEGDRVKRGSVIASVGNTGSSTGPHLHYEVQVDGVPVNPMRYLVRR